MYRNYMCAAVLLFSSLGCYGGWRDCFPCCFRSQEFSELGPRIDFPLQDASDKDEATIIRADGGEVVVTQKDIVEHGNLMDAASAKLAEALTEES